MQTLKKLILFFGCNIIGFSLFPLLYVISIKTGIIDINAEDFDTSNFFLSTAEISGVGTIPVPIMLSFPTLTWIICALFSLSYFFVSKRWRRFFLLAPILLPFMHGFVIMLKYS
ncbi:MAG: hypothetical protein KAJ29_01740 [Alphaproteobacteria bacterium]|nr:hypothetical protein [Alphaproteobacteria bacterium]